MLNWLPHRAFNTSSPYVSALHRETIPAAIPRVAPITHGSVELDVHVSDRALIERIEQRRVNMLRRL